MNKLADMRARLEARDREYAAWCEANNIHPKIVRNRDGTTTEIRGQEVTGTLRLLTRRSAVKMDSAGEGVAAFIRATAALRGKSSGLDTLTPRQIEARNRKLISHQFRDAERRAKKGKAKK